MKSRGNKMNKRMMYSMKCKIAIGVMSVLMIALLTSCRNVAASDAPTMFEMEMTSSYDDSDPFINEKLFFISDDVDSVNFHAVFQMEGESGLLEIADNQTKEVLWSKAWNASADDEFDILLNDLDKEKEYVVRLTCTKVEHAKVVMTSKSRLVKEREKPLKPSKE